MQMLLHLNEDFDDDLLLDALETLNCWISDFITIFISYFNIICNNSSLFPQRKFPLFLSLLPFSDEVLWLSKENSGIWNKEVIW